MVSYKDVQASNAKIVTDLPPNLVGVFIGGTNGIGEYTLKEFARHTKDPRVYFTGRSQEAGDRITKECREINPQGSFTFIKTDSSLIRNVDALCRDLKSKTKVINLLFLTIGTSDFYSNTSEGLRTVVALVHYSRARFIRNLLPELQASSSLKRVVSVSAATKEGPFWIDDINADKVPWMKKRGHMGSLVTLGMEALAQKAPDVSFLNTFPGPVKSGLARDMVGVLGMVVRLLETLLGPLLGPFILIPPEECGAYHLFFATNGRYCPKLVSEHPSDVASTTKARGNDGNVGSGMYCVDEHGESANAQVEKILARLREQGMREKIWTHTEETWERIVGTPQLDLPSSS